MKFVHPAFMAALYLLGLLAASRGGPARMVRLRAGREPGLARAHRLPAAVFAALVVAGAAGGLLAAYWLMPLLLMRSLHFQLALVLLGLLGLVAAVAVLASRRVRWALHLHPLLATAFLLLYLVQAMLGLQILGYGPLPQPAQGEEASSAPVAASALEAKPATGFNFLEPPALPWPPPDEAAQLEPFYAVCPKSLALPAPHWIALT